MWVFHAVAGCGMALMAAWVAGLLVQSQRQRRRGNDAAAEITTRRPALLVVAIVVLVLDLALATWGAWQDASTTSYQIAWLVLMSAYVALAGFAFALTILAIPKSQRGQTAEAFAWPRGALRYSKSFTAGRLLRRSPRESSSCRCK